MSKKVSLSCDICGTRNYSVPARGDKPTERLRLNKFCSHCNKHTSHKQTA